MTKRTIHLLVVLWLTATMPSSLAEAQSRHLTRAQEGRVEVAKCYARCLETVEPMTYARIALDALDGEWSTEAFQYVSCVTDQAAAQRQDACRAGCMDLEVSYGVRSSHIRTRYHWHLNRLLRGVRTAGLWTAWNRFPEPGTDSFIRACARYVQSAVARAAAAAEKLRLVEPESTSTLETRRKQVVADEYRPDAPAPSEFELGYD